jgi:hypothetical protein
MQQPTTARQQSIECFVVPLHILLRSASHRSWAIATKDRSTVVGLCSAGLTFPAHNGGASTSRRNHSKRNRIGVLSKIHAHVTCHAESSVAATIWWVRGSKTKYSPGRSEDNWLKRRRAVSKSFTTASKMGFPPRRSFLRISNEDKNMALSSNCSEQPLCGVGCGPANLLFRLMFPCSFLPSGEAFSVLAVGGWITAVERGVVDLFPYPSLP